MAFDAGSVIARFKADTSGFDSAIKKSGNTIDGLQSRIDRLQKLVNKSEIGSARFNLLSKELDKTRSAMDKLTASSNLLTKALSVAAVLAFGKSVVDTSAKFEKYNAVLTNSLQSQEKAASAMAMIEKVATTTPFSVDELTASYIKFINRGINPTEKELISLGDVAASQGKSFEQLAEAVLDATTGEFERLKEFGVKAGIDKSTKMVEISFRDMNLEIENTPESIQKAIISLGDLEGVSGSMAAISGTLEGRFSNLGDATTALQRNIGDILAPAIKIATELLITFVSSISNFIKENSDIISGIALFTGAFLALKGSILLVSATLPILKTSISGVTAFFSPMYLAIAAIIAVTALLAKETIKYWSQIKGVFEPLSELFADLGKRIETSIKPLADAASKAIVALRSMMGLGDGASDSTSKIAILGTVAKVIMGAISISIQATIGSFRILYNSVELVINAMLTLGKAIAFVISGGVTGSLSSITESFNATRRAANDLENATTQTANGIKRTFSQMLDPVKQASEAVKKNADNVKGLKNEISGLGEETEKQKKANKSLDESFSGNEMTKFGENLNKLTGSTSELSEGLKKILTVIGELAKTGAEAFIAQLNNSFLNAQRRIEIFGLFAQVTLGRLAKAQQKESERAQAESQLQIENFRKAEEEKLRIFNEAEDAKIAKLKEAQLERDRINNEELNAAIAKIEAEKILYLEQQRFLFEQRQAELIAEAETQAQERLVQEANEQDWLAFVERINGEYLDKQNAISTEIKNTQVTEDAQARTEIEQAQAASDARKEAEKAASDARIEQQEKEQAAKLQALKEKQEADKLAAEKKAAGIKWVMDSAALETQKRIQTAQATIQLASGLMSAAAASAQLGVLGIPLFAALSGLLYSTYTMSRAAISSQVVLPPAELLMEEGGVIGGMRHSNGGVRMGGVEAERRELFIDRGRTAMLFDWMDKGMGGGVVVNINAGAFQGVGDLSDASIQMIGEKIGRVIERRSY